MVILVVFDNLCFTR